MKIFIDLELRQTWSIENKCIFIYDSNHCRRRSLFDSIEEIFEMYPFLFEINTPNDFKITWENILQLIEKDYRELLL